MRKVSFGGANSLDKFIARLGHSFDWLLWGEKPAEVRPFTGYGVG